MSSLSVDGRFVLWGSDDRTLKLWDAASGRCLRTFQGHTQSVGCVCMSADGRFALSGSYDRTLKLWDVSSGRCLRTFQGDTEWVGSVCMSSDGQFALSGGKDKTLKLWDLGSGRCLRTLEGHTDSYSKKISLSGDGRLALSGSWDKAVKLWEVATGRCLRTFEGHTAWVISVSLSRDGRYALSGSLDNTLRLWEVASGRCLRTLVGLTGSVFLVSLSADGQYALASGADKTLRLWEVASGRCLRTLEVHTDGNVVLSGDGQYALSGASDRTLRLWDVGTFQHRAGLRLSQMVVSTDVMAETARYQAVLSEARRASSAEDPVGACQYLRQAPQQPRHRRAVSAVREWAKLYARIRRSGMADCWSLWRSEMHTGVVLSVCLGADGLRALSGCTDKTLKLWDVASGRCGVHMEFLQGDQEPERCEACLRSAIAKPKWVAPVAIRCFYCGTDLSKLADSDGRAGELLGSVLYSCGRCLPEPDEHRGSVIGGYELIRQLGEGGMGAVFLVYQRATARLLALKQMKDLKDPLLIKRFQREMRLMQGLAHSNVVRCLEIGTDPRGGPFVVTEFVPGGWSGTGLGLRPRRPG